MTGRNDTQNREWALAQFLPLGLAFLATRLLILLFNQPISDVGIYARYGHEQVAAAKAGVPFYEYHRRAVDHQAEVARAEGTLVGGIEEHKDVEYPPLALLLMRLPMLVMAEQASGLAMSQQFEEEYRSIYRRGIAVIDITLFFLLLLMVRRLFPHESRGEKTRRMLIYLVSTMALWYLLYDRLDLVLALILVLGLFLLIRGSHYGWTFLLLAVGIHYKLVPLVVAPVWSIAALPAGRAYALPSGRGLAALATRLAVLTIMVLLPFGVTYALAGKPALGFFTYHGSRGMEIGSLWGSILLALQALGYPVHVENTYGSINVVSPLSPSLIALAPWIAVILLTGATGLLIAHARRLALRDIQPPSPGVTLAQRYPTVFISYTLLFLMLFMMTNKVFSPQYLLWLAPLFALLPTEWPERRRLALGFLLVCVLSTILVPFLFAFDLLDLTAPETIPRLLKPPTLRLTLITLLRNTLFVAIAVRLFRSLSGYPAVQGGADSTADDSRRAGDATP